MSTYDRLRRAGVSESRARMATMGRADAPAPAVPAVDEALVAQIARDNGKPVEFVRATLQKAAVDAAEAARPATVRAFAKHVEPGPYSPEEREAAQQIRARAEAHDNHAAMEQLTSATRLYREYIELRETNPFAAAALRARHGSAIDLGASVDSDENGPQGPQAA